MIVVQTKTGTHYVVSLGNLWRFSPNEQPIKWLEHVMPARGEWNGDDWVVEGTSSPIRGESWWVYGTHPETGKPSHIVTSPVVFDTNTDEWGRRMDDADLWLSAANMAPHIYARSYGATYEISD